MKTTFRRLGAAARALALMAGFIAAAQTAQAACTGPAGNAGDMIYASNYNSMAFCNGTAWTSMAGGVSVTVNTSGGGATPAGSSADVQFNSSGALAADTGNFTYTSGLLKAPNISATAITASGLGTFGSALVNGGMTVTGVSSLSTVSASVISATYIQIPSATNVISCGSNLSGTMRYTSGTMQVCDGSAWTNIGLGVPQGTIAAFALTSCPNGWSEYTPARGRFLRGIDNGAGIDPSGTRAPGSMQEDAIRNITGSLAGVSGMTGMAWSWGFRPGTSGAISVANNGTSYNQYGGTYTPSGGVGSTALFDASAVVPTSSEDRPVNVAVTFCRYDGFQSQLQTGVATLSSLTDVSVAGATTGQVLTYNGGMWVASSTTGGGTSQGDRITSGTLSIVANTGSAYASLTTNGTTWGYLSSNASYIPTLQTGFENNGTISTTLIQTGTNSATCNSGLYGGIRWNATSDTIQVCNSAGWISVASSTVPNTTISAGTANYGAIFSGPNTLVTDSALYVSLSTHRIGIGTTSPTAQIHIKGASAGIMLEETAGGANNEAYIVHYNDALNFQNRNSDGTYVSAPYLFDMRAPDATLFVSSSGNIGIGTGAPGSSLTVVGEVQVGNSGAACTGGSNGGAIRYTSGTGIQYCNGANTWASLGGGGGTPAGSTGDIQFNTSGAFDADTGKLYWDKINDRLGVNNSSPNVTLDVSGSIRSRNNINPYSVNISSNQVWSYNTPLYLNYYSTSDTIINGVGGNVGIGTLTPQTSLEVSTSTGIRVSNINSTTNYLTNLTANQLYSYNSPLFLNYSYTSNTLINANGGNVGIGTTTPSDRLTVGSTSSTNDEAIHVVSAKDAALVLEADADNVTETDNAYVKLVQDGGAVPAVMGLTGSANNDPEGVSLTDAMDNALVFANRYSLGSVQLGTNGAARMTVRETGNVGIGTNAPSTTLTVSGDTWTNGEIQSVSANAFRAAGGNYGFIIRNDGSNSYFLLTASGDQYGTWNTLRPLMINDATGNVSVGTPLTASDTFSAANDIKMTNATNNVLFYGTVGVAAPGANSIGEKIQLYGAAGSIAANDYALGIESGNMWFNTGSSGGFKWYANSVSKMTLDSSGNLTATAFLYSSDKRLKSDITNLTGGLAKLDALNPVSFRFTSDPSKTIHLGLIAQDVLKVYPEAVHTDDKGYLKLDYPALVGPIVDMLKELKMIVLGDHAAITKLEAVNTKLQTANDNLIRANEILKAANDNARQRLDAIELKQRAHSW